MLETIIGIAMFAPIFAGFLWLMVKTEGLKPTLIAWGILIWISLAFLLIHIGSRG